MAFDFSKLNFIPKLGARARIAVLLGSVVGVIGLIYVGVQYFSGGEAATGASSVAGAPGDLQSVPGGELTPEYYRALSQANQQAAQQAKITGESAIPTLVNIGQGAPGVTQSPTGQCNIICSDDQVSVKGSLDEWVKQGQMSPEVSTALQQLADKKVSVDEYAAELDRLVKEGKLTPEQARKLLEQYKKQHTNDQLKESAKAMDDLIKAGKLPLDVANQLLSNQKAGMSPSEYASALDKLVRDGKLSRADAQMLLAQYTQQKAKDVIAKSVASLQTLGRNGQLTPEVESELIGLENRMVPVEVYSKTLDKFVSSGKLIPLLADKILAEYKDQKASIGPTGSVNKMLQEAEAAAYGEINDLLKDGKMSQEVAVQLTDLIQKDIPFEDYKKVVTTLMQAGKVTPEIAKLKIADYQAVKGLRTMAQSLSTLQGNNATAAAYAAELKRGVEAGEISAAQAEQLLKEYQSLAALTSPLAAPSTATTSQFAALQQRLQEATASTEPAPAIVTTTTPEAVNQFTLAQQADQRKAEQAMADQRQATIDAMKATMAGQAQQLITSWQPPTMQQKMGASEDASKKATATASATGTESETTTKTTKEQVPSGPPIVKAGTILFAVLDTAVNSDYPDSPVLATIVDGPFKGAKLMGKLAVTKGVSGQLDRVSLNFTLMNRDDWMKSKSVTAFAIDPDTARTVLASSVDYHYLQRFGAIMATSFLQGYASAITNAGTSTTGIFGTSTTHPELSPSQKISTALGQVGQTLGAATQNYVNIPPTVKVDSGVGLGILFMGDVT